MEKKLPQLFDFQRFEQNEKLGRLIQETEGWYARELSDESLEFVNAAGEAKNSSAPCGCASGNYDSKEKCAYYRSVSGHTPWKSVIMAYGKSKRKRIWPSAAGGSVETDQIVSRTAADHCVYQCKFHCTKEL